MFYHIISDANTKLLGIDNIGFSSDPNNNRFGPGQKNLYLIHYVISGKGCFNGSPVEKGQGFLIKPLTFEHYYPDTENPWTFLWVTSRDPAMEETFEKFNANRETGIFEYTGVSFVRNLTETIQKNHNKLYSSPEILEIFLHLLNNHGKINKGKENLADIYYNHALNYIHSNLYRRLKVEELTKILGITQPYLYSIFKEKSGMSPKCYIDICKINEAKKLLTATELTISEVANSMGFSNISDFSKFFKNIVGLSPQAYLGETLK